MDHATLGDGGLVPACERDSPEDIQAQGKHADAPGRFFLVWKYDTVLAGYGQATANLKGAGAAPHGYVSIRGQAVALSVGEGSRRA